MLVAVAAVAQTSFLAEGGGHRSAGWLAGVDQMFPTEWNGSNPKP